MYQLVVTFTTIVACEHVRTILVNKKFRDCEISMVRRSLNIRTSNVDDLYKIDEFLSANANRNNTIVEVTRTTG